MCPVYRAHFHNKEVILSIKLNRLLINKFLSILLCCVILFNLAGMPQRAKAFDLALTPVAIGLIVACFVTLGIMFKNDDNAQAAVSHFWSKSTDNLKSSIKSISSTIGEATTKAVELTGEFWDSFTNQVKAWVNPTDTVIAANYYSFKLNAMPTGMIDRRYFDPGTANSQALLKSMYSNSKFTIAKGNTYEVSVYSGGVYLKGEYGLLEHYDLNLVPFISHYSYDNYSLMSIYQTSSQEYTYSEVGSISANQMSFPIEFKVYIKGSVLTDIPIAVNPDYYPGVGEKFPAIPVGTVKPITVTTDIAGAITMTPEQPWQTEPVIPPPSLGDFKPEGFYLDVEQLKRKFPFSIPFDFAQVYRSFVSSPEAPRWEIPITLGNVINDKIVIDLKPFEPLAVILRYMLSLIFTVGLIILTRKIIS